MTACQKLKTKLLKRNTSKWGKVERWGKAGRSKQSITKQ